MIKKIITLLLFIQCVYTQNNTPIVLIGGIAHIGNEEVIENSTIIIVNGKIDKIGPKKSVEFDENNVEIINIQDKHIYPSFILPNTTLGLAEIDAVRASRDEREVGDFNANVRSQIAYNTESIVLSTVRTNGILLAQVTPRGGLITGTSSIMKLAGDNWKKATYLKDDGLHINWPETYHHDHWTHSHDFTAKDTDLDKENDGKKKNQKAIAQLYNFFDNARQYNLLKEKEIDLRFEALQNIFSGSTTLYIHTNTVNGIKEAIMFSKYYNIKKMVIVGGSESWRITEFIKKHNTPIILKRIHSLPNHQDDDIDQSFKTPKILKEAGILFCLDYQGDMERMGARNLPFLAGSTVNYGFNKEEALKLITSNPAKILGISNRTGTLEAGKDANLFISTGDALDVMSNNIELLFLMGEKINLNNHQLKLYNKYLKK